jgi:phage terminase large subunit-like protein
LPNQHKYHFDKFAADRAVTWIEKYITHVKGEHQGKPLILEPWQKNDIVRPLFGWKDNITKLRKYRTVYVEIPRKNAKSTLAGGIGLYLLMNDGEPGAEIYSAAAERGQAGIIFDIAKRMVTQRKALASRATPYRNSITYEKTGSFYKAISADAHTKHGFNAHGIVFDEFHTQKTRALYDVLTTSVGSRRQPVILLLTTAGNDRTSICYELHEYARKVLEGIIIDDTFLPVIYSADKELDIFAATTWKLANPGYGSIVKTDYIRAAANKVKNNPNNENAFRQLHLNQWTSSIYSWVPDHTWMACNLGEINPDDFKGCDVVLGLDLASTDDTTSLAIIFLDGLTPIGIMPYIWVPEEMIERRKARGDMLYFNWQSQGVLHVTPGNVTDYRVIEKTILDINEQFNIVRIGFDKWNSSQLIINLADNIDGEIFDKVEMNIGTLSEPTKRFYKLIKNKAINHGGHPVLRWMLSNVMIYQDTNENIRPSKKSSTDKIDGIMAVIVALTALWSRPLEEDINKRFATEGFATS